MFKTIQKITAVVLVALILAETVEASAISAGQSSEVRGLTPIHGKVDSKWKGHSERGHVYFIQDAHDSVEAQKNIAAIIGHGIQYWNVTKVFEEGYQGEVPVDKYFGSVAAGKKKRASDYYLDQLWVGGAEYARILTKQKFKLIGAEDQGLYLENLRQYREASQYQTLVANEIENLRQPILVWASKHWTRDQKQIYEIWSKHATGKTDFLNKAWRLAELIQKKKVETESTKFFLGLKRGQVPENLSIYRVMNEETRLEAEAVRIFFGEAAEEAFQHLKQLELIERLNQFEVGTNDFRKVVEVLKAEPTRKMVDWIAEKSEKPVVLSSAWETLVSAAVGFYETAQKRDEAVLAKLKALKPEEKAILVFGGFHRENLIALMEKAGISYTVITPRISEISVKHRELYRARMEAPIVLPSSTAMAARSMSGFLYAELQRPIPQVDPFGVFNRSESRVDEGSLVLDYLAQAFENYWEYSPPRHALQEKRNGSLIDVLKDMPDIPETELVVFEAGARSFRGDKGFPFSASDLTEDQLDRMVLWQQNAKAIRAQLGDRQPRKIDWEIHSDLRANLGEAGYQPLDVDLARRFYSHLGWLYADRVKTKIHVAPFIFSLDSENVYYKEWTEEDDENTAHEYHRLAHLIFVHENQAGTKTYPVFTEYFLLDGAIYAYGTSWPAEENSEEYVMTFYVFQKEHGNPFGRGKYERSGKVFEERLRQMMRIYPERRYTIPYNQYRPDQQSRTALSFYWRLGFRFDYPEANNALEQAMVLPEQERYRTIAELAKVYSERRYLLHFPPLSRSETRITLKRVAFFSAATAVGLTTAWLTDYLQGGWWLYLFGIYAAGDLVVNTVAFRLSSLVRGEPENHIRLPIALHTAFVYFLAFLPAFFYQPFFARFVDSFKVNPFLGLGMKVSLDLVVTIPLYYFYLFLENWHVDKTPWREAFYTRKEFSEQLWKALSVFAVADLIAYASGHFLGDRIIPIVASVSDLIVTMLIAWIGSFQLVNQAQSIADSKSVQEKRSEARSDSDEPVLIRGYEGLLDRIQARITEVVGGSARGFMLGIEGPSAIGKGFTSKIVMGLLAMSGFDVHVIELDSFLNLDDRKVRETQARLIRGEEHATEWDFWDEDRALSFLAAVKSFLVNGKLSQYTLKNIEIEILEGTPQAPSVIKMTIRDAWHRDKNEKGSNRHSETITLRRNSVVIVDGKYNSRYEKSYRSQSDSVRLLDMIVSLSDTWESIREKYLWRTREKYSAEIAADPNVLEAKQLIYDRALAPSYQKYYHDHAHYADVVLNVQGIWRPHLSQKGLLPQNFLAGDVIQLPYSELTTSEGLDQKRKGWADHLNNLARFYIGAYPGRYRALKEQYGVMNSSGVSQLSFRPSAKQILTSLMAGLLRIPVDETLEGKFWSFIKTGAHHARLRAALSVYLTGQVQSNHALLKKTLKQRQNGKRDRRTIYMLSLAPELFQAALNFGLSRAGEKGGATYGEYESYLLAKWSDFDKALEADFSSKTGLKIEKRSEFMAFIHDPANFSTEDKKQLIQNTINVILGNFSPASYQDLVTVSPLLSIRRLGLREDIALGRLRSDDSGDLGLMDSDELAQTLFTDTEVDDWDTEEAHWYAAPVRSEIRFKLKEAIFLGSAIYWGVSMGGSFWAYALAFGIVYSARILFHVITFKDADGRIDYTNPWAPKYEWSLTDELEKAGSSEMVVRELGQMRPNYAWKIKARRDGKFVVAVEEFVDWKKKIVLSRILRVREWDENNVPDGWFDSDFKVVAEKKLELNDPIHIENLSAQELIKEVSVRSEAREKFSAHAFKVAIADNHPALDVFSRIAEIQSWKYGQIQKNGRHNTFNVRLWGQEDLKTGNGRASIFAIYEGYGSVTPYKFLNHLSAGLADETEVQLAGESAHVANKRRNIRAISDLTLLPKEKEKTLSVPKLPRTPKPTIPRRYQQPAIAAPEAAVMPIKTLPVQVSDSALSQGGSADSQYRELEKSKWQLERLQELMGVSVESWEQILNSRELKETSDEHLETIWRSWFALAPYAREKVLNWLKGEEEKLPEEMVRFFKSKRRGLDLLIADIQAHLKISENITDASVMSTWTRLPENLYAVLNLFYGLSIPSETRPSELDQQLGLHWQERLGQALDEIGKIIVSKPQVEQKVDVPTPDVSALVLPAEEVPLRKVTKSLRFFIEVPANESLALALSRTALRESERNLGEHGKLMSLGSDRETKIARYEVVLDNADERSVLSQGYAPKAGHLMQALKIAIHDQRTFQVNGKDIRPAFDSIQNGSTLFIFKEEPAERAKRLSARSELRRSETRARDRLHAVAMISSLFQFIKKQNQEIEAWLPGADFLALSAEQYREIEMMMALYPKLRLAIYGIEPRVLETNTDYLALQR